MSKRDDERNLMIAALQTKVALSELVEDYPRAIEQNILLYKFNQSRSGVWLTKMAALYPEVIFNEAKKAVEEGWPQFNSVLGYCYERGCGIKNDMRKAVECYTLYIHDFRAPYTEAFIGICHHKGWHGLEKDDDRAFELIKKAAERNKYAFLLGICYYKGIGCERDYGKAFKLLGGEDGCQKNKGLSAYFLGKCFFYGHGTQIDRNKAFNCFKRAAYYMDIHLQLLDYQEQTYSYLAKCFQNGWGTEPDPGKASVYRKLSNKIRKRMTLPCRESSAECDEDFDEAIEAQFS